MKKGQIIKLLRDFYYVDSNNKIYECQARGKFWKDGIVPLVGDFIEFDELKDDKGYIKEILPRKNELVRPPVSNIDQAIIVISAKEPLFSSVLLDKMLVVIEFNNIKPIIYISKMDLLNRSEKKDINSIIKYYKSIGYKVFTTKQRKKIKSIFKNKLTVITGQSGVGKSTLLNILDKSLQLNTSVISKALGRGKHTTRHVELLPINNGLVADTPGFSSFDLINMANDDIKKCFIEFNKYNCKYSGCSHISEPDCEIKKNVKKGIILESRYNNYLKFVNRK
jgi:ribosome biogenesis GTPase